MTRILVFIAAATGLILLACNPEEQPLTTSVKGTVIDKVTGAPVPGAYVHFKVFHENPTISGSFDLAYTSTGANGQFYFKSENWFLFHEIGRKDYLIKGNRLPGISRGEINYITIPIVPRDGAFHLEIANTSSTEEVVYVNVYSPTMEKEYDITNGLIFRDTFFLGAMETIHTLVNNISSEEMMGVYWDFKPLPYHFKTAPFSDSLFVARNDTATFTISF